MNNKQNMIDVENKDGLTTLEFAVTEKWMPGVHIALEAGADITLRVNIKYL